MRPTFLGFKNPREVVQAPFNIPTVTSKGETLKFSNVNKSRPKSSQSKRFNDPLSCSTTEFVGPGRYTNECNTVADSVRKKINPKYTGEVIDSTIGAVTYAGDSKIIDLSFVSPRHKKSKDWSIATKSINMKEIRSLRSSFLTMGTQDKIDSVLSQTSMRKENRSTSKSKILRENISPRVSANLNDSKLNSGSKILERARLGLEKQKNIGLQQIYSGFSMPVSLNGSFRERKLTPKKSEIKETPSIYEKSPEPVRKVPELLIEPNKESKIIGEQLQNELLSLQIQLEELQKKAAESKATYLEHEDNRAALTPQLLNNTVIPQTGDTTPRIESYTIIDDVKPKVYKSSSRNLSKKGDSSNNSRKMSSRSQSGKENIRYKN